MVKYFPDGLPQPVAELNANTFRGKIPREEAMLMRIIELLDELVKK